MKFTLKILAVLLVLLSVTATAEAIRKISPSERGSLCDVRGVCPDQNSLYSQKDAQIVSCPGDKDFIKSRSSNKASINGLTPSFVCQLAKFLRMNPSVTVDVGTYKTTATTNCDRRQCRIGPNANGGTHEKGCAADLRFGGQKGPGGPSGPPWCMKNRICSQAHSTAPGAGLQFPLMPGGSRNTGYYEVWHIEPIGSRAGYCPTGAESQMQANQGGQGGGQGSPQGGGQPTDGEGNWFPSDPISGSSNIGSGSGDSLYENDDTAVSDNTNYNNWEDGDPFSDVDENSEFTDEHGNTIQQTHTPTQNSTQTSSSPADTVKQNAGFYETNPYLLIIQTILPHQTHSSRNSKFIASANLSVTDDPFKNVGIKDVYGFNPAFARCLASIIVKSGIDRNYAHILSGYRTKRFQNELYQIAQARYGREEADNWVEHPSVSTHVNGIAVDLEFTDEEARAWFYENAKKFGLHFPYKHKPEHLVAYTKLCASNDPSPYGKYIDPSYKPNNISLSPIEEIDLNEIPQITIPEIQHPPQATSTDDVPNDPAKYKREIKYVPWSIKYNLRPNDKSKNVYTGLLNFFKSDMTDLGVGVSFWDIILKMFGIK